MTREQKEVKIINAVVFKSIFSKAVLVLRQMGFEKVGISRDSDRTNRKNIIKGRNSNNRVCFDNFCLDFKAMMRNRRRDKALPAVIDLRAQALRVISPRRIICVGDLHGCFSEFGRILRRIFEIEKCDDVCKQIATSNCHVVLTGDYGGKGNDSLSTLFAVLLLGTYYPNFFTLLSGNHETDRNIFEADFPNAEYLKRHKKEIDFYQYLYECPLEMEKLFNLLEAIPFAARTEDMLFVHGAPYGGYKQDGQLLAPKFDDKRVAWCDIQFFEKNGIMAPFRKTGLPPMTLKEVQNILKGMKCRYLCRGHSPSDPAFLAIKENKEGDDTKIFTTHPFLDKPCGDLNLDSLKLMPAMSVAAFEFRGKNVRFLHNYTKFWFDIRHLIQIHQIDQRAEKLFIIMTEGLTWAEKENQKKEWLSHTIADFKRVFRSGSEDEIKRKLTFLYTSYGEKQKKLQEANKNRLIEKKTRFQHQKFFGSSSKKTKRRQNHFMGHLQSCNTIF
jgi:hypothetical protein